MSICLGIVGAGTIGHAHATAAHAIGATITGIVDTELERAQALAAKFPNAKPTANLSTLLSDSAIEAIVVGVPNQWHKEVAIAAMEAGKDVLLEKPMGLNRGECAEINLVAENTGRVLQIGMANRFSSVGLAAKSLVGSGQLGQIYHAKALLYRRRGVPGLGGWFTTQAVSGGGALIDNGVHLVDLALWLMGFPQATRVSGNVYSFFGKRMKDYVYESMWAGPPRLDGICDVEDSAHALVRFSNGATLDIQTSWALNLPTKHEGSLVGCFGDRGGITFELYGDHIDLASEQNRRNVDTHVRVPADNAFQLQMQAFAKCVRTREFPTATGQQGQMVQTILDAIYQSSQTGQEIDLTSP